jgi:hypothetical protein
VIVVSLFVMIAVGHSQAERNTLVAPGRCQLVPVEYDVATNTEVRRVKAVFTIDTQTGQTWQWAVAQNGDKFMWVPGQLELSAK